MITRPRLHHVTVEVHPALVEACKDFYRDVLGLTHGASPVNNSEWFNEGLHLYWGAAIEAIGEPIPARHFALVLEDRYELVRKTCRERGLLIQDGTPYWGCARCFVRDPAGNRIELMQCAPS